MLKNLKNSNKAPAIARDLLLFFKIFNMKMFSFLTGHLFKYFMEESYSLFTCS